VGGLSEAPAAPAVWAGPECAFLTVGRWACDQLALTGHDRRPGDIDRLAGLGVTAVRYPVLWGRGGGRRDATDWAWAEDRMARLDAAGVTTIAGLLHHGSGPPDADPLDPAWPDRFGAYAGEVARRFPAIGAFLPLNEPVTTARFGALYGWWPPYARDPDVFASLLLALCRGIAAAARAIRAVRSDAPIIVNEDVGRTFASPRLRSVARRHDERRWLAFDLLAGRVDRSHPAWRMLGRSRVARRALDELRLDPVNPDLLGIDHYVTSDRYLDEDLGRFPDWTHAVEGRLRYADVEVARVGGHEVGGFEAAIADAWERYRRPLALTEVQLAGEPADQVCWWLEAWTAASDAVARGIPVRGVTAWSAFGAYDWASILRDPHGAYEPGCYDASAAGEPVPTLLAGAVRATAASAAGSRGTGWWRREDRVLYRPAPPRVSRSSGRGAGSRSSSGRSRPATPLAPAAAAGTSSGGTRSRSPGSGGAGSYGRRPG
jgi:dTDP-4-dehydrorhamnose reductase